MAANGQIDKGTDDPNDRREDRQQKTVAQPAQHRSIEVTVQAGDGVVGANVDGFDGNRGTARGRTGVYGRNSGFATDDNRHPDYYSTGAIAARRAQAKAERDAKQARFNAVADRMNAATARRDAKEASARAERRAADAARYTIDAGAWGEMGKRNGQIREERTELKNDDGSLKLDENGEPQVEVKKFRNEGSMLDAEANKDAIAGVNKWWQEYGQYDQRLGAAKGAFNEKGELDASKLTADQFAELQRVKGNFDAKQKPIQDRIRLHEAENAMRDSDYLYSKGVKVWDTRTGKRNYTPEQAREMARRMRTQEAYGELGRLADPTQFQDGGRYSNRRGGVEGQRDAAVAELLGDRVAAIINGTGEDRRAADEAAMMRRMRDLGFAADQIADKNGNIDLGRIEAALRGTPVIQEQLRAKQVPDRMLDQAVARPKAEIQKNAEAHTGAPTAKEEAEAAPKNTPAVEVPEIEARTASLEDVPQVEIPAQPRPGWTAETSGGPKSPSEVEVELPGDEVVQSPAATATGFMARMKEAFRSSFGQGAERPAMTVGMPGMLPVTQRERMSPAGRKAERDALAFAAETIAGGAVGGALSAGLARGVPAVARLVGRGAGRYVAGSQRAVARTVANPAVRRALTAEQPTTARATMDAVKAFGKNPAKARAAKEAAQKAADIRKADAAVEAAKTGSEKTLDAVGRFWSRAGKKARPRRTK